MTTKLDGVDRSLCVRTKFPPGLRAFNAGGDLLRRLGLSRLRLDPDQLQDRARRQTGLDDFGPDHFREPMTRMLAEVNRRGEITHIGRAALHDYVVRQLSTRLHVQDTLARNPEILDVPLRRPLIVTGIPRSGTTLLHNLLSQDPHGRPLRLWEIYRPCPPPEMETCNDDPRIDEVRAYVARVERLVPRLAHAPRSSRTVRRSATDCSSRASPAS